MPQPLPPVNGSPPRTNGSTTELTASSSKPGSCAPRPADRHGGLSYAGNRFSAGSGAIQLANKYDFVSELLTYSLQEMYDRDSE